MPTAVSVAVIVLVFGALLVFSWRQLRTGGRRGQRPSAQRAVPLGGVLLLSGFLLGVAGVAAHSRALAGAGLLCIAAGEALILLGPRLLKRLDDHRSQSIRRGIGLDEQ